MTLHHFPPAVSLMMMLLPPGSTLPDSKLQLGLSRARTVQWQPGGPRALRRGARPAPRHLRPGTLRTRQLCQHLADQRYKLRLIHG